MTEDGAERGYDGAQPCTVEAGHVWALKGIHLSLRRGAEAEEQCARPGCDTVRYVADRGRRRT